MGEANLTWSPHSKKQADFIFSNKRISIAGTGIQWGKSVSAIMRLKMAMHRYTDQEDNFLVTSPTYKILYQSTLPPFLRWNSDIGHYNKKDEMFEIYGGGKVWFRTNQNPDSVVGITRVRHIICDEAGLYGRYFWDNIQARSSFMQCPISIVTSPYSLNWLYTDFIRPYMNGDENIRNLIHLCQARSDENPYFPRDEYELRRQTMDARRFNMIYGGSFDKAEGLVYDCFDQRKHVIERKKLPVGTRFFGGIDWGFTDPTVISVRAVTDDGIHYKVDESYKTQQRLSDTLDEAYRLSCLYGIEKFYADPSRPDAIAEFNKNGLRCIPAQNEILPGIERHYELIKSDEYYVFKDCKYSIDEYETYHYQDPKDLKPNQNQGDKLIMPVDQANHCLVGDTVVLTISGHKYISDIVAGDMVLTTGGYHAVTFSGKTGTNRNIVKVSTANGNVLYCTPCHKIWTNKGFVRADTMRYGTVIMSYKLGVRPWKAKLKNGWKKFIEDIQNQKDYQTGTILSALIRALHTCIVMFGSTITALFQMAITFIILMVILPTMKSVIWLVFRKKSIKNYIQQFSHKTVWNFSNVSAHSQKHGTKQKREEYSIKGTVELLLKSSLELKKHVCLVVKHSSQKRWEMEINIAQTIAKANIAEITNLTISQRFVQYVKRHLARANIQIKSAVQDYVTGVISLSGKEDVYDLTVQGSHEFFANGILVHNSMDTERYLTMALWTMGRSRNEVKSTGTKITVPAKVSINTDLELTKLMRKMSKKKEVL